MIFFEKNAYCVQLKKIDLYKVNKAMHIQLITDPKIKE